MSSPDRGVEVFALIQKQARSAATKTKIPVPTAEYLVRHALESFLHRLSLTEHADDFVLKGGILLAAYGIRRPTKDVDAEAISAVVSPDHLKSIVGDVAAVDADDGVEFDVASTRVQEIRDEAGLRIKVTTRIGNQEVIVAWDVSTGDPIVPMPKRLAIPRILGEPIEMLCYAPETMAAEKGVTILERGITSTRWRDYVDIVQLDRRHGLDRAVLEDAVRAVADHRGVDVRPITPVIQGYGAVGQLKWAAWRRKVGAEGLSEELLDNQMQLVAAVVDPVFTDIQRT